MRINKVKMAIVSVLLAMMGGCTMEEGKPDTPAYNDTFTQELLKESDEDNFHWLQSKTGDYEILIPSEFKLVDESAYEWSKSKGADEPDQDFVYLQLASENHDHSMTGMKWFYYHLPKKQVRTHYLAKAEQTNVAKEPKVYEDDEKIIYFSDNLKDQIGVKETVYMTAMVTDKKSEKTLEFVFSYLCRSGEGCQPNSNDQRDMVRKMLTSARFMN